MRSLLPTSPQQFSGGFTLIEVLIIAPIVVLAIGGFLALIMAMVGDVLVTRDHNTMTYESQAALDTIEQDVRLSTQFLTTSGAFIAPQGSNNNFTGTAAFTSTAGNALILNAIATNKNPTDATRGLIYYANQPNPCGSLEASNQVFLINVIYFIKDGSLWRRTVVPDFNRNSPADANTICSPAPYDPWQRNSCSPGYAATTRCQSNDAKLMDNIQTLIVQYYSSPSGIIDLGPGNASSATTIKVFINGKKTTAAREITTSLSLRATKLNDISVE